MKSQTPPEETVDRYSWFASLETRWMDNDVYGHVNNVAYYSYFDTAVNLYLIGEGGLEVRESPVIGLVVESRCTYRAPISYPERVRVGVRVDRLGTSSVTYGVAVFRETGDDAAAHGSFVHVFVGRETRRPVPIPETMRRALARIVSAKDATATLDPRA